MGTDNDLVSGSGTYQGVEVEGGVATDGAYSVILADFAAEDTAKQAYEALKGLDDGKTTQIEGVLVVKREPDGDVKVQKMTDHSTRHDAAWGTVGGVVFGVLFPPSVIGSALVGLAGGAVIGELRRHHHKKETADALEDVLEVGHSGLVALVSDPGEVRIRKALEKADKIVSKAVDKATAEEIKAAAKAAEVEEKAAEKAVDKVEDAPTDQGAKAADQEGKTATE